MTAINSKICPFAKKIVAAAKHNLNNVKGCLQNDIFFE
jgi:hypothetical protein